MEICHNQRVRIGHPNMLCNVPFVGIATPRKPSPHTSRFLSRQCWAPACFSHLHFKSQPRRQIVGRNRCYQGMSSARATPAAMHTTMHWSRLLGSWQFAFTSASQAFLRLKHLRVPSHSLHDTRLSHKASTRPTLAVRSMQRCRETPYNILRPWSRR
ncbi:hypothetical protein BD309DRAFT_965190 [Dichomitus squalens]|nr:hypothetical protein BD309DRAFT_965190 [Dichomitus squalens]